MSGLRHKADDDAVRGRIRSEGIERTRSYFEDSITDFA